MILIKKKLVNLVLLTIILQSNVLFSEQPSIIVMPSQKTLIDYAFITATIGSFCLLGKYVWIQQKRIQNLEKNQEELIENQKILLSSVKQNNDNLKILTAQTETIQKDLKNIDINLSAANTRIDQLVKTANIVAEKQEENHGILKALEIEQKNRFELLSTSIQKTSHANEKRQEEILGAVTYAAKSYTSLSALAKYMQGYYVTQEVRPYDQIKKGSSLRVENHNSFSLMKKGGKENSFPVSYSQLFRNFPGMAAAYKTRERSTN